MQNRNSDSDNAADRAAKQAIFLNSLEQWINQVVADNNNFSRKNHQQIPDLVRDSFQRSIEANIQYYMHKAKTASTPGGADTMASYYELMADVYQMFLCDDTRR